MRSKLLRKPMLLLGALSVVNTIRNQVPKYPIKVKSNNIVMSGPVRDGADNEGITLFELKPGLIVRTKIKILAGH